MNLENTAKHFDLSNKVILVTGGTRGLGLAMVRAFAEAGASLVVSSRKSEACAEVGCYPRRAGRTLYGYALSCRGLGCLRCPG